MFPAPPAVERLFSDTPWLMTCGSDWTSWLVLTAGTSDISCRPMVITVDPTGGALIRLPVTTISPAARPSVDGPAFCGRRVSGAPLAGTGGFGAGWALPCAFGAT